MSLRTMLVGAARRPGATRATGLRRPADVVAIAVAFGLIAALLVVYFQRGIVPGDAFTYLAAGERLNAGHPLYALSPGDRPVALQPPFWTVPLLSPPTIAVVFRPLALLGDSGAYLWWVLQLAALAVAVGLLMRRRPILTSIGVIVLSIPLVYEIGVGNLNAFVLLGLILTWRATASGDEATTGALTGVLSAFKITPAVLAWWLLTQRRFRAIGWAIAAGVAVLAISLVGAGLEAHLQYLGIIRETGASGARPLSLTGMALFVGVPVGIANVLPTAAIVAGVVAITLLRRRPDLAYVAAVLTLLFGSPTVSINWFIYLLACLAPVAWPWREASQRAKPIAPRLTETTVVQP